MLYFSMSLIIPGARLCRPDSHKPPSCSTAISLSGQAQSNRQRRFGWNRYSGIPTGSPENEISNRCLCRERRLTCILMRFCVHCNAVIPGGKRHDAKYCSTKCRMRKARAQWHEVNKHRKNVPRATVGAIHEMVVCANLLGRGYHVFRAISASSPCDLAVLVDRKLFLIEVTTGYMGTTGKLQYPPHKNGKFDAIAVVHGKEEITYLPDIFPPKP